LFSLNAIYYITCGAGEDGDHMRNEEVLLIVKEQRNILHEISKRKANWTGHIFRRKLPSTTGYGRKDKRRDRSDRKTRKKA
jgi:hypothetical protein